MNKTIETGELYAVNCWLAVWASRRSTVKSCASLAYSLWSLIRAAILPTQSVITAKPKHPSRTFYG